MWLKTKARRVLQCYLPPSLKDSPIYAHRVPRKYSKLVISASAASLLASSLVRFDFYQHMGKEIIKSSFFSFSFFFFYVLIDFFLTLFLLLSLSVL